MAAVEVQLECLDPLELDGVAVGLNPDGLPAGVRPTRWNVAVMTRNGTAPVSMTSVSRERRSIRMT